MLKKSYFKLLFLSFSFFHLSSVLACADDGVHSPNNIRAEKDVLIEQQDASFKVKKTSKETPPKEYLSEKSQKTPLKSPPPKDKSAEATLSVDEESSVEESSTEAKKTRTKDNQTTEPAADNNLPVEESPTEAKKDTVKSKPAEEASATDDDLSDEKTSDEKKAIPPKDTPAKKVVSDDDNIAGEKTSDDEKDIMLESDSTEEALSDENGLEDDLSDDDDEKDIMLEDDSSEETLSDESGLENGLSDDDDNIDKFAADFDSPADFEPTLRINHSYEFGVGNIYTDRGFKLGSRPAQEDAVNLTNQYKADIRIRLSPKLSFKTKMILGVTNIYNKKPKDKEGFYSFFLSEAHLTYRHGFHTLSVGEQALDIGTLDRSPMNVLNIPYEYGESPEPFGVGERYRSLPIINYQYRSDRYSLALYMAPYFRETNNQKDTRLRNEDNGVRQESANIFRDWFGCQIGLSLANMQIKLGYFNWFDKKWKTDFSQTLTIPVGLGLAGASSSSTFEEGVSSVQFRTIEMDLTFSDYIWRFEGVFFDNKNHYHAYKRDEQEVATEILTAQALGSTNTDGELAALRTYKLREDVYGTSIERKFDKFFVMLGYTFRKLYDVPANLHIYRFENEKTPEAKARDLTRSELSLTFNIELGEQLDVETTFLHWAPFDQNIFIQKWIWNPEDIDGKFILKYIRSISEEYEILDKAQEDEKYFLVYKLPL